MIGIYKVEFRLEAYWHDSIDIVNYHRNADSFQKCKKLIENEVSQHFGKREIYINTSDRCTQLEIGNYEDTLFVRILRLDGNDATVYRFKEQSNDGQ